MVNYHKGTHKTPRLARLEIQKRRQGNKPTTHNSTRAKSSTRSNSTRGNSTRSNSTRSNSTRSNSTRSNSTRSKSTRSKSTRSKSMKSISKNTVIIKDETPFEERLMSRSIHQVVKKRDKIKGLMPIDELVPLIRSDLSAKQSFSPAVNRILVSMNKKSTTTNIFGCGLDTPLKGKKFKPNMHRNQRSLFKKTMEINISTTDSLDCVDRNDPRAQTVLLNNLKSSASLNYGRIIMPLQLKSNCWFNTMFACMFVSDKGRKFFRFFRQLMIEGKRADKVKITPKILSDSFFLLNAAIEASYNKTNSDDVGNLALTMDTNNIITRIFNSIPYSKRTSSIMDVDAANNPLDYYDAIIGYLYPHKKNANLKFARLEYKDYYNLLMNNYLVENADIYTVELIDYQSKNFSDRVLSFTVNGSKYVLDSVIMRDKDMFHFCAMITCGGVEYGYDGASMSRLNKFSWKKYINKDKEWTFEGSNFNENKSTPILWNFRSSYQILFYYRVN